jgi:GTP-binding protein Era
MAQPPDTPNLSIETGRFRCGTITLAGRSNVGKSTLLNRLLGEKVAITSKKPQTTRSRVLGISTFRQAQLIWIDTPGIHRARSLLNRRMVDIAQRSILDADAVALVVDASQGLDVEDRAIAATVVEAKHPWLLVLNKIDRVGDSRLVPLLERIGQEIRGVDLVPVSAKTGKNLEALERAVTALLPEGERMYPEDQLTDQSERTLVQEFVREQILAVTDGEVPYRTAVVVERFEEKAQVNVISATILVERDSQKSILIGSGGSRIRQIGTRARLELERFCGKRFFLELFVKVRRDWTKNPRMLTELGL